MSIGRNRSKLLDAKRARKQAEMGKPGYKSRYALKTAARRQELAKGEA